MFGRSSSGGKVTFDLNLRPIAVGILVVERDAVWNLAFFLLQ